MAVDAVAKHTCEVQKRLIATDELVETFSSVTEAARRLDISFTQIKRIAETRRALDDQIHYLCLSEDSETDVKARKERIKPKKVGRFLNVTDAPQTWDSMKKAAKECHLGESTVKKLCETEGKDKEGFTWKFFA